MYNKDSFSESSGWSVTLSNEWTNIKEGEEEVEKEEAEVIVYLVVPLASLWSEWPW